MRRIARFAVATSVLFLLPAVTRPAQADPITITNGYLDISTPAGSGSSASVLLEGAGFQFTGSPDLSAVGPTGCRATPCPPGSPIDLRLFASGGDILGAKAMYNGASYTQVGSAASESSATIDFEGTAISPAFTGATTAFVQAPFTFTGSFFPGNQPAVALAGTGMASIWLTLDTSFGGTSWFTTERRYDFAVTPEPAPLLLLGTGLLGAAAVMRRRSDRRLRRET